MEHETKKEWFARSTALGKVMYTLGCIKLRSKGAADYKYRYTEYIRRLNPFSWVFIVIGFMIGGINRETLTSLKNDTVWW